MKKIKIGINGFGRLARTFFRINLINEIFEVVAINEINPDNNNIAYLLQYDSTYGRLDEKVTADESYLYVANNKIKLYHETKINEVPWEDLGVEAVIDASGIRSNLDLIEKMPESVKNVFITNSPSDFEDYNTIIFGVNEDKVRWDDKKIISTSICDTIAMTPILNILSQRNEIESGFLTTLHPWLNYQNLLDGPSVSWSLPGDINSHYALGRSSVQNIIPKTTSAVSAANRVFPGLTNKIKSFSYRIPTSIVSSATLVLLMRNNTSLEDIKKQLEGYESQQEHKVVHTTYEPLTAVDFAKDEHSTIIDLRWLKVEKQKLVHLQYWYDNEWGYSSRVVDSVEYIGKQY
jgi:glyceraldehyde 3-phosphate dehydrogenase